ncbi:hypothetical protein ACEWY4_026243 [Coilia grayii]|uniref:ALMS motif domain-containing protein n=1 Tax=Coilia grayii TaxID=363190 RepID=A0ABD1IY71_9TELE
MVTVARHSVKSERQPGIAFGLTRQQPIAHLSCHVSLPAHETARGQREGHPHREQPASVDGVNTGPHRGIQRWRGTASREQRASVERDTSSPQHWQPSWGAWPERRRRREVPVWVDSCRKPSLLPTNNCTQPHYTEALHPATHSPASAPKTNTKTNTGFSSITITSRKVLTRSASLPESGALSDLERPRPASPEDQPSMSRAVAGGLTPSVSRRRAVVVKMTESRVTTTTTSNPTAQTTRTHNGPESALSTTTAEPRDTYGADPVVLRRKAAIVKVTEERGSFRISPVPGQHQSEARRSDVRYSFTEGLRPSHYTAEPQTALSEGGTAAEKSIPKLHRSTLSLHLSTQPLTTDPAGDRFTDASSCTGRHRRPASFHAGMWSHSQPALDSFSNLLPLGPSPGVPQTTAVEPAQIDLSKAVSPPSLGPVCGDAKHPEVRNLGQAQELTEGKPLPGAVLESHESQPPPALINSGDSSLPTPDAVLAHNAAAIIASIKLQRQLSKKKAASDSPQPQPQTQPQTQSSPRGEGAVEDAKSPENPPTQACDIVGQDTMTDGQQRRPYAEFVPFTSSATQEASSLREALQLRRPGFISRSEARVKEVQRRAQLRRQQQQQQQHKGHLRNHLPQHTRHSRAAHTRANLHSDNLFKPRDRAIIVKETQQRSRRKPKNQPEMKPKKEEEKKKAMSQTNRLRVDIFTKKLLDQLLHRDIWGSGLGPAHQLFYCILWSRCRDMLGLSAHPKPVNMSNRRWTQKFALLTALHVIFITTCFCGSLPFNTAKDFTAPPGSANQQSPVPPPPQHHLQTTTPLLLIGGQRKPISHLQSLGHPASLQVLVEAEGEELLLRLERNEERLWLLSHVLCFCEFSIKSPHFKKQVHDV